MQRSAQLVKLLGIEQWKPRSGFRFKLARANVQSKAVLITAPIDPKAKKLLLDICFCLGLDYDDLDVQEHAAQSLPSKAWIIDCSTNLHEFNGFANPKHLCIDFEQLLHSDLNLQAAAKRALWNQIIKAL